MAREGESTVKAETAPDPDDPRKPSNPTELKKPSIKHTLKSAVAEFNRDQVTDLAAALTYYAVLSIFPALLAIISVVGVFGDPDDTVEAVTELLRQAGQGDVAAELEGPIASLTTSPAAGFGLVVGLAGAIWAASNYVNGFGRAMNRIYQVDEGRPFWKLRPKMLGVTILLLVIATTIIFSVVLSGEVARQIGAYVGLGEETVTIWNIAKWPVILLLVVLAVAILYYFTPNVQQPRFRWVSVGALIAIVIWIIASIGFGFYVSNFGNYERTYGSLAGVIIFLLWIWLTNTVILFGAEVDAEMERARQLQAGIKAEETIQLPPRDARQSDKAAEKLTERVEEGRRLRLEARAAGATGHLASPAGTDSDSGDSKAKDSTAKDSTVKDSTGPAPSEKIGGNADPADTDAAEAILEPLPSDKARSRGYSEHGAHDSARHASISGRDWQEESLERDVRALDAQRKTAEGGRSETGADKLSEDKDDSTGEDLRRSGALEPLPSERARQRGY